MADMQKSNTYMWVFFKTLVKGLMTSALFFIYLQTKARFR
ncbi:hypothetical protein HMPREF0653_02277 [Prevotella disiens JCM 6334 = ATCC 29426]|uniref:Uncharacterized protein n=1 Tax=Prevotella disiens JCM 6334 = ATCC 29426 TaxID=1235811 RepID=A0ABP2Y4R8_9BACT|nr:hypothetical protein HMPREF0653_02277 [Prevotella disiens JCM 6334 = ATCC 29426]